MHYPLNPNTVIKASDFRARLPRRHFRRDAVLFGLLQQYPPGAMLDLSYSFNYLRIRHDGASVLVPLGYYSAVHSVFSIDITNTAG